MPRSDTKERSRHTGGCRHPVANGDLLNINKFAFANWIPISIGMTADTTAIILDPSVNGTERTYTSNTWTVTFPNYTISGISTCNNSSGTYGTAHPEYNFEPGEKTGIYCWCRMTNPARSAWVYMYLYSSVSNCASSCAVNCGDNVRVESAFRRAMYATAGQ